MSQESIGEERSKFNWSKAVGCEVVRLQERWLVVGESGSGKMARSIKLCGIVRKSGGEKMTQ